MYEYDRGGNILSKAYYVYTTGEPGVAADTILYSYTDSNWKDKLTAYDGQTITYDAIGNPLNDGTWTYTWEKGCQLKQMSKSGMTVEFKYDHNGLRTQKKVTKADGTVETTDYTLHGKLVMHLTRGEDEMHFFYDAQSRPAMVEFNGTLYGYVHNLQGDVVGIVDNTGSLVVEYKYDAWGKPVITQTLSDSCEALAELNPFRYRGYVYDGETGLYYLRKRYYNPKLMRFINEDYLIEATTYCQSHNVFSYCMNRVTSAKDPDGTTTYAIGVSAAINFFGGFSDGVSWVWDDYGNSGWMGYYGAGAGASVSASFGISVQVTEADTIFELVEPSYGHGMSAGPVSGDLILFDDDDDDPDGVQFTIGPSIGADLYHVQEYTTYLKVVHYAGGRKGGGGSARAGSGAGNDDVLRMTRRREMIEKMEPKLIVGTDPVTGKLCEYVVCDSLLWLA